MKLRGYIDTAVFSAYFDARWPDRQAQTEAFWARIDEFHASTSTLSTEEIERISDPARRSEVTGLLRGMEIHPVTEEMKELAHLYIARGVFTPTMVNDALHVAAAVFTRQDVLVSWNFRHLVNRRRRARINEVDISLGLPVIDIVAPPEV